MITEKTCTKCGETKPISEFYKKKSGRLGVTGSCKECVRADVQEYRDANREECRLKAAVRRVENPLYYQDNKASFDARSVKWREANRDQTRVIGRRHYVKRYSDPKRRLDMAVRGAVWAALKGQKSGRSTFDILGYSLDDLMVHLEAKFTLGMTWDSYGEWHVDHIIPKSVFKYHSQFCDGFKSAWALTNLQPLWAKDNLSKHARLDHPSQVGLLAANDNRLRGAA